jgi:hypothetical protein
MKYNLKGLATVVAKTIAEKIAPTPKKAPPSRDPWLNDNIRKAEINAAASRGDREGWIPRRPGWLRSRGARR